MAVASRKQWQGPRRRHGTRRHARLHKSKNGPCRPLATVERALESSESEALAAATKSGAALGTGAQRDDRNGREPTGPPRGSDCWIAPADRKSIPLHQGAEWAAVALREAEHQRPLERAMCLPRRARRNSQPTHRLTHTRGFGRLPLSNCKHALEFGMSWLSLRTTSESAVTSTGGFRIVIALRKQLRAPPARQQSSRAKATFVCHSASLDRSPTAALLSAACRHAGAARTLTTIVRAASSVTEIASAGRGGRLPRESEAVTPASPQ